MGAAVGLWLSWALGVSGVAWAAPPTCAVDAPATGQTALACNRNYTISTDTNFGVNYHPYPCDTRAYPGRDLSYRFTPPPNQHVWVTAAWEASSGTYAVDFDLFALSGDNCGPSAVCLDRSTHTGSVGAQEEAVDFPSDGSEVFVNLDDRLTNTRLQNLTLTVGCSGVCDPTTDLYRPLTCSSNFVANTANESTSVLNYYPCGEPNNTLLQTNREHIYSFSPQASGPVTFRLSGMTRDHDLYVLEDVCDPQQCLEGSTKQSIQVDSVTFDAVQGRSYFIVVEAYRGTGPYTLSFVVGSGGCPEDCDDGLDNDSDGLADCADVSDCGADPACLCDGDGDGVDRAGGSCAGTDCDDDDATIYPGAPELCDGKDNDCDGPVDEGAAKSWYVDSDGDGWGTGVALVQCAQPSGRVDRTGDCNDGDAAVNPGAVEACNGRDDNCNGQTDEGVVNRDWFRDGDGDGFGAGTPTNACAPPAVGWVAAGGDCNDGNPAVKPGAPEVCNAVDDDCDGLVDDADPQLADGAGSLFYADTDGDAFGNPGAARRACARPSGFVTDNTDCDDRSAVRAPGRAEVCDGKDNDCDRIVDEGTDCYDDDGDGTTERGGDCDDTNRNRHPRAVERCDGVDEDCDGVVDNGTTCFDDDGDGATEQDGDCNDDDAAVGPNRTEIPDNGVDDDCDGVVDAGAEDLDNDGYTVAGGDCVPTDPVVRPGAPELLDGKDNDCDGRIDEGTAAYDDDGDGYSEQQGDCDDSDPAIHPAATEQINGVDDDCDGRIDNGGPQTDDDGDGVTEEEGDCDDDNANVFPGQTEAQNGIDDDCDGRIDERWLDLDRDGYTTADGDCNDADGWVNPGLAELCGDGVDNDCDGQAEEGCDDGTPVDPATPGGCGCQTPGPRPAWALLGLALLVVRRRGGR